MEKGQYLHFSRDTENYIKQNPLSSYPDFPTGLPVYLPKSLSVWISKILMSVCQTRTVY